MATIKLPYIDRFKDRHGHVRLYYRRPGGKRHALPPADAPDFLQAYEAARRADKGLPALVAAPNPDDKTINALIVSYYGSTDFTQLRQSTKLKYRGACEWLRERYGTCTVAGMRRADVVKMVARKAKKGPAAGNTMLKVIRVLIRHALDLDWRQTDPTLKMRKAKEGSYHTWTDAEVAAFEAKWSTGTRERLAFALALYTGQRRADVAAMTWADIDRAAGTIRVVQEKTGTKLTIPLHPDLSAILAQHDRGTIAIVCTGRGTRLTTESFGNLMADAIGEAGLPDECVLHGVRKAAARRLAEAGCSAKEIQSITGHKTLGEVQRYTDAVDQERLAGAAILKFGKGKK